ncbi:MAG: serine/threonine protein kinase [Planctomycetaceae bacterium]|nr:serine/threonine protein kinase [Planctomycetaceae bacterium]
MVTGDLGACEWFVWDLRRSGLIDRGQLDTIVGEFLRKNPRAEAPALAEYLVSQGTLTGFQAERVLNSKSAGLVLGPYVLMDAIGSGSMGQVYKASSKNDANFYAVKVLPRRSMWNVRLARRQVRSFAGFTHPAVVPFMDVGTAGGLHYLVWPLVEGTTLESIVQHNGKLPPNLAALYGLQIAQGLTDAHQNSLFHGLVKPSNIMIGSDNQARMLDFGIGSLLVENEGESLVDTMSTANTLTSGLDCASPESIMEPTNRTPAGDQYSLGCVLYYCLTGRVPFPEGSAVEKMMAHQTKEPMPIQELAPDVPDQFVDVIKKLMAKTPEERFSGCDELVEALEPFVGDPNAVPGGVPGAAARGSGSSGGMPALGSRPGGRMGSGSGPKMPGLPTKPAPAATPAPAFGNRANPTAPAAPPGRGGVPVPSRSAPPPPPPAPPQRSSTGGPSRATLHLPPVAEDDDAIDTGSMPPPRSSGGGPKVPTRGSTSPPPPPTRQKAPPLEPVEDDDEGAWAEEEPTRNSVRGNQRRGGGGGGGDGGGMGQWGLVAAVVLLMVGAFFLARVLMQ